MMRVNASVTGDWEEAFVRLRRMKDDRDALFRVAEEIAEEIARRTRELITSQSLDLVPISKSPGNDADKRVLIESGTYVNSIQVVDVQESGNTISCTVSVGDGMTDDGEMTLRQLAFRLEYGDGRIPGNMPIHQSWENMRADIQQMAREKILAILKEDVG